MVDLVYEGRCCGILELDGIEASPSAEKAILDVTWQWFGERERAYIFFSTTQGTRGVEVAQYIRKHKLGVVRKMPPTVNGNTGKTLTMWVWAPDKKAFRAFWQKNKGKYDAYEDEDDN